MKYNDLMNNSLKPSSMDNNKIPFGDNAILEIFLRFSKGKVRDLLLIN